MKPLLSFFVLYLTLLSSVFFVQAVNNEEHALVIVNKLEAKVATKTDSQKKIFYTMIVDVLHPHRSKHPVIPLVQNVMKQKIAQLETVQLSADYSLPRVDLQAVQTAWFGRVNDFRKKK